MAKSNFIVRGGADFSGIKKELTKTQAQFTNLQKGLGKTMKFITATLGTLAIGKFIKDSTGVAMAVESAMDNIARNMGESNAVFNEWVQNQSRALGIAKSDAYKYGSTFSNLLSSFTSSAKETSEQTQDLMKAAAIISSKTGRSYDDTANRIRSGMLGSTEAIEDLGVYTNISMIESTEAFKKFANGKTWAQLTFQTQQQIRLAAILEQTYSRYGDELADTTQTRQARLIASLKNIQMSFGQAFLPIYNAVLPALTALANKLEYVIAVIAKFMAVLFGFKKGADATTHATNGVSNATSGIGDATDKAADGYKKLGKEAKKAQGFLAGFDEVNTIPDKSDSGGAGGADGAGAGIGDMPGGTVTPDINLDTMQQKVEEMKSMFLNAWTDIKGYFSTYFTEPLATAFEMLKPHFAKFKTLAMGIFSDISTLGQPLKDWFIKDFTPLLQNTIKNSAKIVSGLFETFNMVFEDIWNIAVFPMLSRFITDGLPMWAQFTDQSIETFTTLFTEVKKLFDMLWREGVVPALNIIMKIWNDCVDIIKGAWDKYGATTFENIRTTIEGLGSSLKNIWDNFLKPIWDNFMETLDWLWTNHLKPLVENAVDAFFEISNCIMNLWNKTLKPIIDWLVATYGPMFASVFNTILNVGSSVFGMLADVISGIITVLKGVVQFITGVFTGDWRKAIEGLSNIFKGIFDGLGGIVKGIFNIIIDVINGSIDLIITNINTIIKGINKISGAVGIPAIPVIPKVKIPKLANGGITNGPTLAMIGDNPGGREVISPLDDLKDLIASAVGTAVLNAIQATRGNETSNDSDVVLQVDGTTFARLMNPYSAKESSRLGNKLILQTI